MAESDQPAGVAVDRGVRPLREGEVMGAYMEFDRNADRRWTNAEYLVQFGLHISRCTVQANTEPRQTFEQWWDSSKATATPDTYRGWEESCRQAFSAGRAA